MPLIKPLHGIYYNPSSVKLGRVLSPPYDVISAQYQRELYDRDPKNAVRLEFGKEENRYEAARRNFREWLHDGTLILDASSSIYLLSQTFESVDGKQINQRGFLALCRLEDPATKNILPHERTFPKPKEDRLKLLATARAQFSPIFSIYSDASKTIASLFEGFSRTEPFLKTEFEGVRLEVWRLDAPDSIRKIQTVLKNVRVFIADGHHRYETALEYQRMRRSDNPSHDGNEGYNFTLMYFSNIEEEGLVIYPIHRVVRGLERFEREKFFLELGQTHRIQRVGSGEELPRLLRSLPPYSFGIVTAAPLNYVIAIPKDGAEIEKLLFDETPKELKALDVVFLHTHVIPKIFENESAIDRNKHKIDFIRAEEEVFNMIESGQARIGFILNPTRVEQVQAAAKAGLTMPQKSTYFYPKLPAGLIMYDLERK